MNNKEMVLLDIVQEVLLDIEKLEKEASGMTYKNIFIIFEFIIKFYWAR